jgi:glucan phosphoethanolaminetransferase (alkaline phosphatase superfamily)
MNNEDKLIKNVMFAIIAPMIIGLISGMVILYSLSYIRGAWEGYIHYDKGLSTMTDIHVIFLSFILFMIVGALCVCVSLNFTKNRKWSLIIGVLTSAMTFVVGLAYTNIGKYSTFPFETFFENFRDTFQVNQLYLLMTVLLYTAIAICGSLLYVKARKSLASKLKANNNKRIDVMAISVLVIVAVIISVIPLAGAAIGKSIGVIERTSPTSNGIYEPLIKVSVQRVNNSSIMITNEGGLDSVCLRENIPFTIYITPFAKTASNMEAIRDSGLSVAIEPAGGLENWPGAYVNITGRDVERDAPVNAEYQSVHVTVMGHFKDGSDAILVQADI